ncbi:hypothetical protein DITRI_Ditri07aG0107500 [Diplodiscus trichospermus]
MQVILSLLLLDVKTMGTAAGELGSMLCFLTAIRSLRFWRGFPNKMQGCSTLLKSNVTLPSSDSCKVEQLFDAEKKPMGIFCLAAHEQMFC